MILPSICETVRLNLILVQLSSYFQTGYNHVNGLARSNQAPPPLHTHPRSFFSGVRRGGGGEPSSRLGMATVINFSVLMMYTRYGSELHTFQNDGVWYGNLIVYIRLKLVQRQSRL